MPESSRNPEAETPYETAVDEFYALLDRNTATAAHIQAAAATLLSETIHPAANRQMYIDHWSQRHAYDTEGVLLNVGDNPDELPETEDIITKKLALLSDATALLVASEHSTITNGQKEQLLNRAGDFFVAKGREHQVKDMLGASVAPYLAHNIDMVSMGDNREERAKRGKFVLNAMTGRWLIRNDLGPTFRNAMRRALKN